MLERFGIARELHMDHQGDRRKVDSARRDVGRHAHSGPPVAQRLERLIALVLAVLPGQGDGMEAALGQAGVQPADRVARGAEQYRRLRLVEAKQIDHGMLDVGRGHRDRLVGDILVPSLSPTVSMRRALFW